MRTDNPDKYEARLARAAVEVLAPCPRLQTIAAVHLCVPKQAAAGRADAREDAAG